MATILQIELRHFVNNHGYEAVEQDNGVALLAPVRLASGQHTGVWSYVETYRDARKALGY